MRRWLMFFVLLAIMTLGRRCDATTTSAEDIRVKGLIRDWAPLVWLAPGERFLPLGVPEFLENVEADNKYLRTRLSLDTLLQNRSSFLHGRKPAGNVPIYAVLKNCMAGITGTKTTTTGVASTEKPVVRDEAVIVRQTILPTNLPLDELPLKPIETNNVLGSAESLDFSLESLGPTVIQGRRSSRASNKPYMDERKRRKLKLQQQPLHFHVTYWMFYPFSEGKAVCVLDLGFLGSWPIPSLGGLCLGKLKEYGNHVGDWEHVSLYFKGKDHPLAMYVSAHDAGAFYRYEPRTGTFHYESQETRKSIWASGIFQKPIFPERVYTSDGSHPVLFSARGSHGLWTAPGKHKFVRLPRLYDESGFGTPWPTWRKLETMELQEKSLMPEWMRFTGKWGNPKSNCHPLAKLGFNICEFVDGPTGIPMKKMNFRC